MIKACTTRTHWLASAAIVIVCAATLASCSSEYPPGESALVWQKFAAGMVDATDLPFGWGDRRSIVLDVPNAIGRGISYTADSRTSYANVNQHIMIYPSADDARMAYEQAAANAFPAAYADKWLGQPDLAPYSEADQMRSACLPGLVNGLSQQVCVVVAQYGTMLMDLSGIVFEDHWLTMEQFKRLVERVDAKMYRASMLR